MLRLMKKKNLFHDYAQLPGSKPMWQIAFEAGAGSVEFMRQIATGHRTASEEIARGIEIATAGHVSRAMLLPAHRVDAVWGDATAVVDRMKEASADPEGVRRQYLRLDEKQPRRRAAAATAAQGATQ